MVTPTTPGATTPDTDALAVLDRLTDGQLATVEELARRCLGSGATLADVRGYTNDEMEAVYAFAHNAYRQGKYEDAAKLFHFLAENDHTDGRFWMGLGACLHMTGGHDQAVAAYAVAAVLDATNPEPPLRAAECYLATGALDGARKALDAVRLICDEAVAPEAQQRVLGRVAVLAAAIDSAAGGS
ncbi:MAG: SycD/LcrH family type III secretion system chaperone [Gammaproteobacteria bacterium]|nr:SycD/LcrH family type III secretion system chaperone [Gammaproteobacteria bacterium]